MTGNLYTIDSQEFAAIASRRGVQIRTSTTAAAVDVKTRFFRGDAEKGISK